MELIYKTALKSIKAKSVELLENATANIWLK